MTYHDAGTGPTLIGDHVCGARNTVDRMNRECQRWLTIARVWNVTRYRSANSAPAVLKMSVAWWCTMTWRRFQLCVIRWPVFRETSTGWVVLTAVYMHWSTEPIRRATPVDRRARLCILYVILAKPAPAGFEKKTRCVLTHRQII